MVTTDANFRTSLWAWSQLDKRRATATPTYGEGALRELTRPLPVCAVSPGRGLVPGPRSLSPVPAPSRLIHVGTRVRILVPNRSARPMLSDGKKVQPRAAILT